MPCGTTGFATEAPTAQFTENKREQWYSQRSELAGSSRYRHHCQTHLFRQRCCSFVNLSACQIGFRLSDEIDQHPFP